VIANKRKLLRRRLMSDDEITSLLEAWTVVGKWLFNLGFLCGFV